jgi:hypothetical protein
MYNVRIEYLLYSAVHTHGGGGGGGGGGREGKTLSKDYIRLEK